MQTPYSDSSYDDYACLKPPLLLWVTAVYLSRAIILPFFMGMSSTLGTSHEILDVFHDLWNVQALIPSTIAAAVFIALLRRGPGASSAVRWVWAHGRAFLAVAAVLDLIVTMLPLARNFELDQQTAPGLIAAVVDLYFLLYVVLAQRVRDTFGDFPPRLDIREK
jgi:hypothetical protein